MSMPYVIDTSYQPVYLTQANMTAVTNSAPEEDTSILAAVQEKKAEKLDVNSACTDGNDNGKIEDGVFGLFLKKTGEGLLKKIAAPVTEALKGNFIPAIATVAGIALACNPVTGPFVIAIGTGAAALGVASSAVAVGSDIKALNDCANTEGTTDADAKAIVDQMGDHAANGILSLTALIGGIKAMRGRAGTNMNDLKLRAANGEKVTLRQQVAAYGKDTLNAGRDVAKAGFGKLTHKAISSTGTAEPKPIQEKGVKQDDWQSSRAEAKVRSKSNSNIEPTNKNLTIEQAQKELSNAIKTQQEGINNRTLTKADYKANQKAIEQAQANLDYAKAQAAQPVQQAPQAQPVQQAQQAQNPQTTSNTGTAQQQIQSQQNNTSTVKPTNKKLTVEQAQTELDAAKELMNNRGNTRADYKTAQQLVKEAQANLDYAKAVEAAHLNRAQSRLETAVNRAMQNGDSEKLGQAQDALMLFLKENNLAA